MSHPFPAHPQIACVQENEQYLQDKIVTHHQYKSDYLAPQNSLTERRLFLKILFS